MHIQGKSADTIFRVAERDTTEEAPDSRKATGGMVLGKSYFDFSMLVFSVDFPLGTKSRRKRTKTADALSSLSTKSGVAKSCISKNFTTLYFDFLVYLPFKHNGL